MIQIAVMQQTIQLLPHRAIYWVEKKIIIVSDIHLGKASAMQNAGLAVPEGAMDEDLYNLKTLIENSGAERCLVVGDLIHAKSGLSERVQLKFEKWLSSLNCVVELILGNHDYSLRKQLPQGWKLLLHSEQLILEPFCFAHIPKVMNDYFVWSGHIHPQFLLKGRHDQLTLRCFLLSKQQGILPAFSDFVGGAYVTKNDQTRLFVIAQDQVIEI